MPQRQQRLQVKSGQEYWQMVEETARLVDSWPDWKKGEPSGAQRVILSDRGEQDKQPTRDPPAPVRE
jgi:hypothetical protein